mmetsp:Transcript_980/g.1027  ORF Transcript_980/g.1027 Transcript_980/m.1027 type:complete len:99 (-) Transcript_980:59-355(-)
MEDQLTNLLADLDITVETSRSKAKKNKPDNLHRCLLCFYRFQDKNLLRSHLKVHRADRQQIKEEFQAMKILREEKPDDEIHKENYQLALAKITLLEKF